MTVCLLLDLFENSKTNLHLYGILFAVVGIMTVMVNIDALLILFWQKNTSESRGNKLMISLAGYDMLVGIAMFPGYSFLYLIVKEANNSTCLVSNIIFSFLVSAMCASLLTLVNISYHRYSCIVNADINILRDINRKVFVFALLTPFVSSVFVLQFLHEHIILGLGLLLFLFVMVSLITFYCLIIKKNRQSIRRLSRLSSTSQIQCYFTVAELSKQCILNFIGCRSTVSTTRNDINTQKQFHIRDIRLCKRVTRLILVVGIFSIPMLILSLAVLLGSKFDHFDKITILAMGMNSLINPFVYLQKDSTTMRIIKRVKRRLSLGRHSDNVPAVKPTTEVNCQLSSSRTLPCEK